MARIIESSGGERRIIKMSANDIISIVREYQRLAYKCRTYENLREILQHTNLFIPEDL